MTDYETKLIDARVLRKKLNELVVFKKEIITAYEENSIKGNKAINALDDLIESTTTKLVSTLTDIEREERRITDAKRLSRKELLCYSLVYYSGYSTKEVAKELELSDRQVRRYLEKSKNIMQK